jgi:hypothetical protein
MREHAVSQCRNCTWMWTPSCRWPPSESGLVGHVSCCERPVYPFRNRRGPGDGPTDTFETVSWPTCKHVHESFVPRCLGVGANRSEVEGAAVSSCWLDGCLHAVRMIVHSVCTSARYVCRIISTWNFFQIRFQEFLSGLKKCDDNSIKMSDFELDTWMRYRIWCK